MALITLTVQAENAEEYHEILEGLAGDPRSSVGEWGETIPVTPEGEQPAKRTRRTKAQIEADNAAAATAQDGTAASGASESQPSPSKTSASDPFGDQIREVAAEAKAEEAIAVTMADLRKVASEYMTKHGAKKLSELLLETGGAPNLTNIPTEKYATVAAALMNAG